MSAEIACAGAGFSGAVIARRLADAGLEVAVFDPRPHVAGNCHTARCPETGVLVHVYGPHIFHTADAEVWAYVNGFARFRPYRHQVRATLGNAVYSMPVNLHTINQFFGRAMRPDEARAFVSARCTAGSGPARNFEQQALRTIGPELYEAFFRGYTQKQWGAEPATLPASVLRRLPLRFSYDDSYFDHPYQGLPEDGYTALVARILDHPRITVTLAQALSPSECGQFAHVFWSAPLDAWFGHDAGRLGYRTLDFVRFTAQGDWQGCAVMNHPDAAVAYTRITEHKHLAPWETHDGTVCYREYSRACGPQDIPFYPIRLTAEMALLADYESRARALSGVTFVGRLGTYRYIDMDVTIREALDTAQRFLDCRRAGRDMPALAPAKP